MSEERQSPDEHSLRDSGILEAVSDSRLPNPLSEVTRQERKILLIVSLIALTISIGGLVPTEIQALGVKLTTPEQNSILFLVALSILYLLVGFFIYALADHRARDLAIALGRRQIPPNLNTRATAAQQRLDNMLETGAFEDLNDPRIREYLSLANDIKLFQRVQFIGTLRFAFDFVVPILVGLGALGFSLYSARSLYLTRMALCQL